MVLWSKKGRSGFSTWSTADQVTEGVDGTGLTAIVTGGTNGIGKETVRTFARRGVHVFIGARNTKRAAEVKDEILKDNPAARVDIIKMDTSILESVREAAQEFLALNLPLNILVNNAGIACTPYEKTKEGFELQFATNYLGHFLLTNLFLDKMKETAKESGVEGKIINVSSVAHNYSVYKEGIRFEKLNDEDGYSKFKAYGQSKLAQIIFTKELARRLREEEANVTVNCLHPGTVQTNIANDIGIVRFLFKLANYIPIVKSAQQGAAPQCYLALNPAAKDVTGKYYMDDVNEATSPSKFVEDEELAKKLWDFSLKLTSQQAGLL